MANTRQNLILQQISEGTLTTRSATMKLGYLARADRWLRRYVPGYNWLRGGKRSGGSSSRTSLRARGVSSGFIVSAKMRARIPKGNRPHQPTTTSTGVFLETGISKSEFCNKLDYLLRKKLLELDAIQVQEVEVEEEEDEGEQTDGTQGGEDSDLEIIIEVEEVPMEDVEMEEAQPGEVQAGNDQAGNGQGGNEQAGNNQAGNNQIENNQTGNNEDQIIMEIEITETEFNRNQDRALEEAETEAINR